MARMRRRSEIKRPVLPEITLTPLIDTVLVLLVVFMIATPLLQNSITIELPTSSTNDGKQADAPDDHPINVSIDKSRELFIDGIPVSKELFFNELEKKLAGKKDTVVYVHADTSIPYGVVIGVVDDIKYLGGVKYVALATEHA